MKLKKLINKIIDSKVVQDQSQEEWNEEQMTMNKQFKNEFIFMEDIFIHENFQKFGNIYERIFTKKNNYKNLI